MTLTKSSSFVPPVKNKKEKEKDKEKRKSSLSNVQALTISRENAGSTFSSEAYEKSDVCYRKAFNSMKLSDIFMYLDCLVKDEYDRKQEFIKQGKKADGEAIVEEHQMLMKRITKFISITQLYKSSNNYITYDRLFYEYQRNIIKNLEEDFITSEKIYSYYHLLSIYIHSNTHTNDTNNDQVNEAKELLNFFGTHNEDPYSCLLGLTPAKDVLQAVLHFQAPSFSLPAKDSHPKVNDFSVYDIESEKTMNPNAMFQKILSWSVSELTPEEIVNEIKQYATILRGVHHLKDGAMIIIQLSDQNYIFGRFHSVNTSNHHSINAHIDVDRTLISVTTDKVFTLPQSIKSYLHNNHFRKYEKLIQSPVDPIFNQLLKTASVITKNKLRELNINLKMISKANKNQCSFLDLSSMKSAYDLICTLNPPPEDLLVPLRYLFEELKTNFSKHLDVTKLFQPTQEFILKQLESFEVSSLLIMEIQRYKGILSSALDQINIQKRDLLNGTRKNDLVANWHGLIRQTVIRKLATKFFFLPLFSLLVYILALLLTTLSTGLNLPFISFHTSPSLLFSLLPFPLPLPSPPFFPFPSLPTSFPFPFPSLLTFPLPSPFPSPPFFPSLPFPFPFPFPPPFPPPPSSPFPSLPLPSPSPPPPFFPFHFLSLPLLLSLLSFLFPL